MLIANRYELHEQVGVGGMGAVFRALDTHSGETVAIKRLKDEAIAHTPGSLQRFQREAEALRQLNHPNIVKVLGSLEQDNQHFIIMEYVDGSLHDLLGVGELPISRVLSIALDIADALTRAHRLNIIHRDLKPANVLIAADGLPRLSDFGIAHMERMERVTDNKSILGTPNYLPPEALMGADVDSRADIWSFGVMLFEMIAGKQPFSGDSIGQILTAILKQPTPNLEALRPGCPVALVDLVYRMLEKDRGARISSVRQVGVEVEAILRGDPVQTPSPVKKRFDLLTDEQETMIGGQDYITPILAADERPKHNLPVQITPFVGRENELGQLANLLAEPAMRLLTILAPGGMGKTRLALEVGQAILRTGTQKLNTSSFVDGVFFVSLAPLASGENIVPAVAEAVSFQFYAGGDPKQQLLDFFREKRILLLMDNCEHVLEGVNTITDILHAAAGVKVIATSRQRLNLSVETVFKLDGMDFPDWGTADDALEYSAVKLFTQSARRVTPDFQLKADDLKYVAQICRAVQGMPLAILLAAAWVDGLSLQEIAEEIGKSLDFLETEMSDIPTRQRSIRALFDYSWNLLNESEQIILNKLSAFRGGFTREAANAVANASLRPLTALVSKSLLRRDPDSGRYEFHELLRQYGEEQLEQSGEKAETQAAHSAYFAHFLRLREPELKGQRQQEAGQAIEIDFDNIRQAWYYTVQQAQIEQLAHFLYALNLIAYQHKQYSKLMGMFAYAVETLRSSFSEHRAYGRLLVLYGQCLDGLGQYESAEINLRQALAIAQAENDSFGIGHAALWLARVIDSNTSKRDEAWQLCEKSIHIFQELGDDYERANALHYRGYLLWSEQKHQESLDLNRQVLEVRRRLGDDSGAAASLYNIVGSLYFINPIEAETQCREVLALFKRLHQPFGIGVSQCRLAAIELYKGNVDIARQHVEDALKIARANGFAFIISDALVQLAWVEIASDRFGEAEASINQDKNIEDEDIRAEHALIQCFIYLGLQDWPAAKRNLIVYLQLAQASREPISILGMGLIVAMEGQTEHSVELVSWAMTASTSTSFRMRIPMVSRHLSAIQTGLSEAAYAAAWGRGKMLKVEEAVAALVNEAK
jgi:serine/threonine protein kinase/predicted ATPase